MKLTAAIWAIAMQFLNIAGRAEGAFKAANHSTPFISGQITVANLTIRAHFQHGISPADSTVRANPAEVKRLCLAVLRIEC